MINLFKAETGRHCSAMVLLLLLSACQRSEQPESVVNSSLPKSEGTLSEAGRLGKKLFFDAALSGSGKMSCATCHSPDHAYGPPNDLAVQMGGAGLNRQGLRAVPSLRYVLNRTPFWSKQFVSNPVERMIETDTPPIGGLTWDGRFNTLHEQANAPLLADNEMANSSSAAVVDKVKASAYSADVEHLYGSTIWQEPARAYAAVLAAIERFELEDPSFHPYTSKFDRTLKGQASLTDSEARGLKLFVAPDKGNCASCHLAVSGADQSPPLFTDFSFSALGAPRNTHIEANRDPAFYDLGLCGPVRSDLQKQRDYCGMFKTPGLRNVARRSVFLHNGVFTDLATVVRFYVERDIHPEKWYPKNSAGTVIKYNDLPSALRKNVDVSDAPLNQKKNGQPALNEAEIRDVVAFLQTLSDD